MGSDQIKTPTLKIIVIGGNEKILQKIFPIEVKNKNFQKKSKELNIPYKCRKYIQNFDKLNIEFIWEAFLIENFTTDNLSNSLEFIFKMLDLENDNEDEIDPKETSKIIKAKDISTFDRKYIIIKFGNRFADNLLSLLNGECSRVFLPQIAIVTDEILDDSFTNILYDNRFITIIKENKKNIKETTSNIYSYLWDRENYYNERGNTLNDYSPTKINKKPDNIHSFINILVVGISRAGKSTLINLLSRKLVSLESPEGKSITTKINEYLLERTINGDDQKIGIKIIDTPGLKKSKEKGKTVDYTKKIIDLIEHKMKECLDSKDDIHLIYFVFGNNTNFEDHIDFFKFLKKINKKRVENNQKEIPIIFIGNNIAGKEGGDSLRKILRQSGLKELIENIGNKKEKIDFKKYANKYQKKEKTVINNFDNIIEVNFIKNLNKNIYGIDKILKTTLYFLKRNNPFNNFDKLEALNKDMQKYITKLNDNTQFTDKEEKDFIKCKEKIKTIMLELCEKNYLLNQIKDTNDILIKSRKKAEKFLYGFMVGGFAAGLIPFPFADLGVLYPLYCLMIVKLGHCYSITFDEIPGKDYAKLVFGLDTRISKVKNPNDSNLAANVCEKTTEAGRIIGNTTGFFIGNEIGSNLAQKIGFDKVKDWGIRKLRFVRTGGRKIFENEIKEVGLNESKGGINKILEYIIQIFPSIKGGVKKGVKSTAKSLGEEVGNIYRRNTIDFTAKQIEKQCLQRSAQYTEKVASEAGKGLAKSSKSLYKFFLPVIGSIIGGVLDCWGTYTIGNNAIKYFEDFTTKTLGAEYVIKQKYNYTTIFNYLENVSNENFEVFEFDYLC